MVLLDISNLDKFADGFTDAFAAEFIPKFVPKFAETFVSKVAKALENEKCGVTLKIQNDGGDVTLPLSYLLARAGPVDTISIKNKGGSINLEGASSSAWGYESWSKVLLAAGAVYWYRNELRIVGRGVLAGAKLAIERCERSGGRVLVEKDVRSGATAQEGFERQDAEKQEVLLTISSETTAGESTPCVPGPSTRPHIPSTETIPDLRQAAVAFLTDKVEEVDRSAIIEFPPPMDEGRSMYPREFAEALELLGETLARFSEDKDRYDEAVEDARLRSEEAWSDCNEAVEEQEEVEGQGKGKEEEEGEESVDKEWGWDLKHGWI